MKVVVDFCTQVVEGCGRQDGEEYDTQGTVDCDTQVEAEGGTKGVAKGDPPRKALTMAPWVLTAVGCEQSLPDYAETKRARVLHEVSLFLDIAGAMDFGPSRNATSAGVSVASHQ
eukprot:gnl/TRDRNA2_/TRDRNA2_125255_c0_seq1.p3 gnl/TRDRNA2_/TRDRNA2_125255_c0~~gnl/TRDRNA2_/TRDRNA2_125255_c0_seq1.p3  ORF type:complete len:115 (+),score=14.87 gnl/TRDRNA2_/TRDRNA2_125255_c0_seq1:651-995(+)